MRTSLEELDALWESLGDVPVEEIDELLCIDEDWHTFTKGTDREDIWHWFEEQNPAFSVGKKMS